MKNYKRLPIRIRCNKYMLFFRYDDVIKNVFTVDSSILCSMLNVNIYTKEILREKFELLRKF